MKKMLKFNFGKFSIYLLVYAMSRIILIIIEFVKPLFFLNLYFINIYIEQLGQIIGGLSIYLYQYKSIIKNKNKMYFELKLIQNKANIKQKDKRLKILILLFLASTFDFFIVILEYYFSIPMKRKISPFFKMRIGAITSIVSSLLCLYSLNFKFGKHQKVSIIFMSVILIIEIILEILVKSPNILIKPFIFQLFLMILRNIVISFIDCIDKYLYEVNYVNPFKLLIIEGIFKFIFVIIFTVSKNIINFEPLKKFFREKTLGIKCGFILLLFGDLFFSAMVRIYQIYCNVIYSPTLKTLADYIFLPLSNIFSLIIKQNYYNNIVFFVLCEIFSIIIDFFGCVYNELIILFCCGLVHDTKLDIYSRAELPINNPNKFLLDDIQKEQNNSEHRDSKITLDNYYLNINDNVI